MIPFRRRSSSTAIFLLLCMTRAYPFLLISSNDNIALTQISILAIRLPCCHSPVVRSLSNNDVFSCCSGIHLRNTSIVSLSRSTELHSDGSFLRIGMSSQILRCKIIYNSSSGVSENIWAPPAKSGFGSQSWILQRVGTWRLSGNGPPGTLPSPNAVVAGSVRYATELQLVSQWRTQFCSI
ncbi:hypothetical protein TNCV_2770431 [Trichonephila clavipes]|nr:hypothetical protein TNCV_2770431 [Trichonephila clavipes]